MLRTPDSSYDHCLLDSLALAPSFPCSSPLPCHLRNILRPHITTRVHPVLAISQEALQVRKGWLAFVQKAPYPVVFPCLAHVNTNNSLSTMNSSDLGERHKPRPSEPDERPKLQVRIEAPGPAAARQRLQQQRERVLQFQERWEHIKAGSPASAFPETQYVRVRRSSLVVHERGR